VSTDDAAPVELIPVRNRLDEIPRVSRLVEAFGEAHGIPADICLCLNLALDEVLTNIVSYAYEDARNREILVRLRLEEHDAVVEVEDDGRAFDPLARPRVDFDARAGSDTVGGLGIELVRRVMDDVVYRREGGRNVLVMRKAAPPRR
jgi:anti-sigma regulatory factor (Ser/Thr protein kinase)